MHKRMKLTVKFLISLTLLGYFLSKTELARIVDAVVDVQLNWIFWAFVLLLVGKVLSGYRWQKLLQAHDINIPMVTLLDSLYVGQFFNSFLPSTIGGDAIRMYDSVNFSKKPTKSVATIFLDRLMGMQALAFLAIIALGIGLWQQQTVSPFLWLVLFTFGGCLVALFVIFNRPMARRSHAILSRLGQHKLARYVNKVHRAFQSLGEQPGLLLNAFVVSLVLQINVVLYYYFVSLALGLNVSLLFYFIIIPIILVILLIPFSINGIGLREGAYIFFLGMVGTTTEDALTLSLLAFMLMQSQALIGGILFALRGVQLKALLGEIRLASTSDNMATEN